MGGRGGKGDLGRKGCLGELHNPAIVLRIEVDIDVAGQGSLFVADHGRASRKRDFGDLLDGNLRAGRSGDEHAAELLDVVAKIAVVPDVDRIAFAALDVFRDHFTADPRTDRLLDISNGQAVAGSFEPVDFEVDVKALRYAFREDEANFRN